MIGDSLHALTELGFTGLEAEVYALLVREAPSTGYRIAQVLGKPAANVYKAVESLQAKGAVLVEEGESRLCRAVPPEELLDQLARSFHEKKTRAATELAKIRAESEDERVYQIRSREQVLERARALLARCEQVALIDAFPGPLEELRPEIEAAAARGLAVSVKAYAPTQLGGVTLAVSEQGEKTRARWPGEWLNVLVDGRELLWALLKPERQGVFQAVWTRSPYLAWVSYSGIHAEIVLTAVRQSLAGGASAEAVRQLIESYERHMHLGAPGYELLMQRFAGETTE